MFDCRALWNNWNAYEGIELVTMHTFTSRKGISKRSFCFFSLPIKVGRALNFNFSFAKMINKGAFHTCDTYFSVLRTVSQEQSRVISNKCDFCLSK